MPIFLRSRFLGVLVSFLFYFAVAPLLGDFHGLRILTDIFFSAILLSGVFAVSRIRYQMVIATALALPMIVAVWISRFAPSTSLLLIGNIFGILFFGYTAFLILSFIFRAPRVSQDMIFAAIVVYFFLGLFWAGIYSVLEILAPGAFNIKTGSAESISSGFVYFSYTTLTTLGYGDIVPVSSPARSFANLEAIIGQLYLAVMIARLVGVYVSQS